MHYLRIAKGFLRELLPLGWVRAAWSGTTTSEKLEGLGAALVSLAFTAALFWFAFYCNETLGIPW